MLTSFKNQISVYPGRVQLSTTTININESAFHYKSRQRSEAMIKIKHLVDRSIYLKQAGRPDLARVAHTPSRLRQLHLPGPIVNINHESRVFIIRV